MSSTVTPVGQGDAIPERRFVLVEACSDATPQRGYETSHVMQIHILQWQTVLYNSKDLPSVQ